MRSQTSVKSWPRISKEVSLNGNSISSISRFEEKIARIQMDRPEEHASQQKKNAVRWFNL
jgi:hypothetical protein